MKTLKAFRKDFGLSQSALAEMLGVSRSTITMAESGRRKLPSAAFVRLVDFSNLADDAGEKGLEMKDESSEEEFAQRYVAMLSDKLASYESELLDLQQNLEKIEVSRSRAAMTMAMLNKERTLFSGLDSYTAQLDMKMEKVHSIYKSNDPTQKPEMSWRIIELQSLISLVREQLEKPAFN